MEFQLPELSVTIPTLSYGVVGLVAVIAIIVNLSQRPNLDAFPTVGPSSWLGSWWACFRYLTNAANIIQEGYEKHKSIPFKIAEPSHWSIVLSNRKHIDELARAPEDVFSLSAAMNDQIQMQYTMGLDNINSPHYDGVVRSRLTRNIEVLYPSIRDEIVSSLDEVLDLSEYEWKSVPAMNLVEQIACRTINRAFVGLPLCRDVDWIDLNIRYTFDVIKGGIIVGLFPKFLRPLAVRCLTNIPRSIARGVRLLRPIIQARREYMNEYGSEWDEKPNDLLSWLMDETEGPELTEEYLTIRLLVFNFAAIHTTSNFFTQVLFRLAANPQYLQALRDEVEGIVMQDGWTKVAVGKMQKIDSFLKECLRMTGVTIVSLTRKALKDHTFSDGTFVPKGTVLCAAAQSLHNDKNLYENPEVFEPFRFVDAGDDDRKHQFASTSTTYLPFGLGKHACSGRFFAANTLKLILAHIVVAYDVKLEDDTSFPQSFRIGTVVSANPFRKVMFRKRAH